MEPKKLSNETGSASQPDIHLFLAQKDYSAIPIIENATGLLLINVVVNDVAGFFYPGHRRRDIINRRELYRAIQTKSSTR